MVNGIIAISRPTHSQDVDGYDVKTATTVLSATDCLLGKAQAQRLVFQNGIQSQDVMRDAVSIYKRCPLIKEGDIATVISAGIQQVYVVESVQYSQALFSNHVKLHLKSTGDMTLVTVVPSSTSSIDIQLFVPKDLQRVQVTSTGALTYTVPAGIIKMLFIGGVFQEGGYTLSGSTLTFDESPPEDMQITIFYQSS